MTPILVFVVALMTISIITPIVIYAGVSVIIQKYRW